MSTASPSSPAPPAGPQRRWALTLSLSGLLGLLVLLGVGMTRDPHELPSVLIGQPWPAGTLPALEEGPPAGIEQWRGRARLVNLWASWCETCREEQPVLLALAGTLRAQGRSDQLIGLNYKDRRGDALAWLQRWGNPFDRNVADTDGRMAIELGVYGAPESFVIDAEGRIAWKHAGALTSELVAREVLPRLGAQP